MRTFSFYRDAEIRGATLLLKMLQREKDPEAQVLFSRHIADETRHAWLWTRRIRQLGAFPVEVPDGYQRRLGKAVGVPSGTLELFALTVVIEERSVDRYTKHATSPWCDADTRAVLDEVSKDEKWHISWMEEWLMRMARSRGQEERTRAQMARYRELELQVFEEFKADERAWLGFSWSDDPAPVAAH